jgi:hypothetical protein
MQRIVRPDKGRRCLRKARLNHRAKFPFRIRRLRLNHDVGCCNIRSQLTCPQRHLGGIAYRSRTSTSLLLPVRPITLKLV